jgi:hypothetical protein
MLLAAFFDIAHFVQRLKMSLLSSFTTVLRLTFPDAKLPLEKASTEYSQLEEFCRAIEDHPTYTCGKDHIFRDAEIGRPNCVVIVVGKDLYHEHSSILYGRECAY